MSQNQLYRSKVLEKMTSSEQLNSYIKVSVPHIWLILGAIIILLISAFVWLFTTTVEIKEEAVSFTRDGVSYCWLSPSRAQDIHPGMLVRIGDMTGTVVEVSPHVETFDDVMSITGSQNTRFFGIQDDNLFHRITMKVDGITDGINKVYIIKQSVKPSSVLFG